MKGNKATSIVVKLAAIGVIVAALMLPLYLIRSLVSERENRSRSVAVEVAGAWGGNQTIAGPVLALPLRQPSEDGGLVSEARLYLLPDELRIETEVDAMRRRRGLFETVVYTARMRLHGRFRIPAAERMGSAGGEIRWDEAAVILGLSDLKGLSESPSLTWQGELLELAPTAVRTTIPGHGISAAVPAPPEGETVELEATLAVNGTGTLDFLPLGRETTVRVTSEWPDPSFQGAFLPASPEVSVGGFTASWSIPYFARGYPQYWLAGDKGQPTSDGLAASAFGVEWLLPVDFYQKTERCTKYGLLFIVLTFTTFLLFELLNELRVHPVQYLMVGFAICLFYQLLLALSEHFGFAPAYSTAAAATAALIAGYSSAVLGTRRRAAVLAAALVVLYAVLFVLVQLQTYALLVGSVALFLVLALFMYLTRDFNWYELSHGPDRRPRVASLGPE